MKSWFFKRGMRLIKPQQDESRKKAGRRPKQQILAMKKELLLYILQAQKDNQMILKTTFDQNL